MDVPLETPPEARAEPVKPGVLEYGFWAFLVIAIGRVGELLGLTWFPLAKLTLALPLYIRLIRWKRLPGLAASVRPMARTAGWRRYWCALAQFPRGSRASAPWTRASVPGRLVMLVVAFPSRSWVDESSARPGIG